MPGKGQLLLTGHLGDIMKESAQAALSFARSQSEELGLPDGYFDARDIHIHVPEGAIPKDGPSAGITMAVALLSVFTGRAIRSDVAMTGEVTLRGNVLPVGGIKEKVLSARHHGIDTVILPRVNRKNLDEIPKAVRRDMKFVFVRDVREVFEEALLDVPVAASTPRSEPRRRSAPVAETSH